MSVFCSLRAAGVKVRCNCEKKAVIQVGYNCPVFGRRANIETTGNNAALKEACLRIFVSNAIRVWDDKLNMFKTSFP
jgi:hypothetical protein